MKCNSITLASNGKPSIFFKMVEERDGFDAAVEQWGRINSQRYKELVRGIERTDENGESTLEFWDFVRDSVGRNESRRMIAKTAGTSLNPDEWVEDAKERMDAVLERSKDKRTNEEELFNRVAKTLRSYLDRDSVLGYKINDLTDIEAKGGYYVSQHDVVLDPRFVDSDHSFLHEMVHAVTSRYISSKVMGLEEVDSFRAYKKAGDKFFLEIERLFEKMKKDGSLENQYGMRTMMEFVSEYFSNGEFKALVDKKDKGLMMEFLMWLFNVPTRMEAEFKKFVAGIETDKVFGYDNSKSSETNSLGENFVAKEEVDGVSSNSIISNIKEGDYLFYDRIIRIDSLSVDEGIKFSTLDKYGNIDSDEMGYHYALKY